ncbi:MAG: hypothetical protein ABJG68_01525 [Crocinitomicaceae bacterium]
MKHLFILIPVLLLCFSSCKKCKLRGDNILTEDFNSYGDWLLYSEYSQQDAYYSRIEDGNLKLKTDNQYDVCPRATLNLTNNLTNIDGFQVCIHIKKLSLLKSTSLDFYFSMGQFEMHVNIEKAKSSNTFLVFKVDKDGITSNLKGALNGQIGQKIENDNFTNNFIQISLCPNKSDSTNGQMYVEIEGIEMTTL